MILGDATTWIVILMTLESSFLIRLNTVIKDFSIMFMKNFANVKTAARRLEKLMRFNEFVLDTFRNFFNEFLRPNLCIYSIYLSTAGIFDTNQAYAKCALPFSSYILG
jgi:hypothetical protein